MSRNRKKHDLSPTYSRAFVVTLGLAFSALSIFVRQQDAPLGATWPLWGSVLLALLLTIGAVLVLFGLFGPTSKMECLAELLSRHEASLIVIMAAYPVYLLLLPIYGRR